MSRKPPVENGPEREAEREAPSLPRLIAIQSVPRSGSSWLGQIFKSAPQVAFRYQPLFSYAFKGRLGPASNRSACIRFFQDLRCTTDPFVLQKDSGIHPDYPQFPENVHASHLVMKEVRYHHILRNLMAQMPELRVIGLVRHPCAVLDSWIHAPREFKREWDIASQWRSGALKNQGRPEDFFGFDKWKEVAQLFLDLKAEHPVRMQVVRYADLNADPVGITKGIFEKCGLAFGTSTEAFIHASQSKDMDDTYSVYRKARPDDAWENRLAPEIAREVLEELGGSPLECFL